MAQHWWTVTRSNCSLRIAFMLTNSERRRSRILCWQFYFNKVGLFCLSNEHISRMVRLCVGLSGACFQSARPLLFRSAILGMILTHIRLSSSSIIWYRPMSGGWFSAIGHLVTFWHWTHLRNGPTRWPEQRAKTISIKQSSGHTN